VRCLREAADQAPFSGDLTGAENRSLHVQCQCEASERSGK
jgi:hypothetical protein